MGQEKMSFNDGHKLPQKVLNSIPNILEPDLLRSAKQIYETYCKCHVTLEQQPVGVAVNSLTYKGQLLFTKQPLLLPWESFIPIHQILSSEGELKAD